MSAHGPAAWRHADGYVVSTDPARLDLDAVVAALASTYWCRDLPRERIARSITQARAYGLYAPDGAQAGFARVVTDQARFAWLSDVIVLEPHRGRGLGKWLVEVVLGDPALAGLQRWLLATRDAQPLYRRYGFRELDAEATGRFVLRGDG